MVDRNAESFNSWYENESKHPIDWSSKALSNRFAEFTELVDEIFGQLKNDYAMIADKTIEKRTQWSIISLLKRRED